MQIPRESGSELSANQHHHWDPKRLQSRATKKAFREVAEDLVTLLQEREASRPKQVEFDGTNEGHVLLLVASFTRMQGAVSRSDLETSLKAVGLEGAKGFLERSLAILESVGLIGRRRRHTEVYFVPLADYDFIRYAYVKGSPIRETARARAAIRQSLDSHRKSVVASSLQRANLNG